LKFSHGAALLRARLCARPERRKRATQEKRTTWSPPTSGVGKGMRMPSRSGVSAEPGAAAFQNRVEDLHVVALPLHARPRIVVHATLAFTLGADELIFCRRFVHVRALR